jgi:integral membrane protein (TIGR01906 family)
MQKFTIQTLKILIILLAPLIIVPGVVRLLATDQYLAFEYGKSDFPKDIFGFAQSQRFDHASDNLRYIVETRPPAFLADQKHGDTPLYTTREVSHMQDVQNVFQSVWNLWRIALALFVFCVLMLAFLKQSRKSIAGALKAGGLVTIGLFAILGISAAVAWQAWFVLFHRFFFVEGSWLFNYGDTLIRLFPQQFWFDSAVTVSSLSLLGGVLFYFVGRAISTKDILMTPVT